MFTFFTILFLVFSIVALIKGDIFQSVKITMGEDEIKRQQLGTDNYVPDKKMIGSLLTIFLVMLPFAIAKMIYLCVALSYDPFTYPTLALLVYLITSLIIGFTKKKTKIDLSTDKKIEDYRKSLNKKRTVKGVLISIVYIVHLAYMLVAMAFM
ncbi:hypothetical protein ACU3L3_07475 [Priestia endophytica]